MGGETPPPPPLYVISGCPPHTGVLPAANHSICIPVSGSKFGINVSYFICRFSDNILIEEFCLDSNTLIKE